eukprot:GHRR01010288.1.p1 GENE.GHRR01010288.1~~GHRR01010288.1.p1  ORF type:complete len:116 (-),score=11.91 GHRR01010288.1:605-952(-)
MGMIATAALHTLEALYSSLHTGLACSAIWGMCRLLSVYSAAHTRVLVELVYLSETLVKALADIARITMPYPAIAGVSGTGLGFAMLIAMRCLLLLRTLLVIVCCCCCCLLSCAGV